MRAEKAHRIRLRFFGILTVLIMAAIFLFSAQSGDESGKLSDGFLASLIGAVLERLLPPLSGQGMDADIRKYAHMAEFFCLGVSVFLYLSERFTWRRSVKTPLFSLAICFLYACSDEVHQLFVPGRAGMFRDVLIDSVGFSIGILLVFLISIAAGCSRAFKQS